MFWGPERYGVWAFSILLPFFIASMVGATFLLTIYFQNIPQTVRLALIVLTGIVVGFSASAWAHFLPCFLLICDGSYYDNENLRTTLSWLSGQIFVILYYVAMIALTSKFQGIPFRQAILMPAVLAPTAPLPMASTTNKILPEI